ncbi:hypothetical protein K435DRAFT_856232 [Dendrothele bispora CBS 962.96]|uniref:Uncharacterized protein n=1 Tax=Dendrothele bispora (strain CBS 962.96) TaxID=1314807 RepID=A0A4S8M925_DENBC|nr:hypothetical protein K435DRAFT_856232 [Dendrothele bispora CBS 962.96]
MVWTEAEHIHSELGTRSAAQIFEDIMQSSWLRHTSRKANRFNAFLHVEMLHINEALEPGQSCCKVDECVSEIAAKWNTMSEDERKAATDDALKKLSNSRENHQLGHHNSAISTFHDVRTSMDAVKIELQRVNDSMHIQGLKHSSLLFGRTLATTTAQMYLRQANVHPISSTWPSNNQCLTSQLGWRAT